MSANVVFMGTPEFAVPSLEALLAGPFSVVAVVTQPDRPSGRGKKLTPPPVKLVAEAAGIPVLQPKSLRKADAFESLAAFRPDVIVVAAFGQILRPNVLQLPPHGCINVHASLLPRWRGAAPINAAIRAGDAETGVTIMKMDEGLDTGPMLAKRAVPITPQHTAGSLTAELARVGGELLVETLSAWLAGRLQPQPQNDSQATLAPRLNKEEGNIDWSLAAVDIERLVRAFDPWPGTFTFGPRGQLKILAVEVVSLPDLPAHPPGTLFKHHKMPLVATGNGAVRLQLVQPAGKKAMSAEAMLNGMPDLWGAQLGEAA